MIVAMQSLIPDPRAVSSEKKSDPAPTTRKFMPGCLPRPAVGLGGQQATTINPQPRPAPMRYYPARGSPYPGF
jgi:hypothetical protein